MNNEHLFEIVPEKVLGDHAWMIFNHYDAVRLYIYKDGNKTIEHLLPDNARSMAKALNKYADQADLWRKEESWTNLYSE